MKWFKSWVAVIQTNSKRIFWIEKELANWPEYLKWRSFRVLTKKEIKELKCQGKI